MKRKKSMAVKRRSLERKRAAKRASTVTSPSTASGLSTPKSQVLRRQVNRIPVIKINLKNRKVQTQMKIKKDLIRRTNQINKRKRRRIKRRSKIKRKRKTKRRTRKKRKRSLKNLMTQTLTLMIKKEKIRRTSQTKRQTILKRTLKSLRTPMITMRKLKSQRRRMAKGRTRLKKTIDKSISLKTNLPN